MPSPRVVLGAMLLAAACSDEPTVPSAADGAADVAYTKADGGVDPAVVRAVRELAAQRGVVPLSRPSRVRPQLMRLGQALLFDPILSGNRNIACMTWHLAGFGTGDGKALSVGEGATGFGPERTHPNGVFALKVLIAPSPVRMRTRVYRGEALRGSGNVVEAEALLLEGYEAGKQSRTMRRDGVYAARSLVRLYEAQGRTADAAKYKAVVAAAPK